MSNVELNKGDQFILAVDVSGSMKTTDGPAGKSRIEATKENCITIAREASKWDPDGIDVLTFGHQVTTYPNVTAEKAADIIGGLKANEGMTLTAEVIEAAYEMHKKGGNTQTVLFLFTDGEPADREKVKSVIRKIASDLKDEHEFAISLLTVGNIEKGLQEFLTDLDDNLGAKHDIVDVKRLEEVDFMAAFMGALHD